MRVTVWILGGIVVAGLLVGCSTSLTQEKLDEAELEREGTIAVCERSVSADARPDFACKSPG